VECDVAASSRLDQINPTRRQRLLWHKHVLALGPSPQGDHRLVLDEQHNIPYAALLPQLVQAVLESVHRTVRPPAKPPALKPCRHGVRCGAYSGTSRPSSRSSSR
jgi:hypothetical protein